MKLSAYIRCLVAIHEAHGDLPVETADQFLGRHEAMKPELGYSLTLGGRFRNPKFWDKFSHDESARGDKVVRV